MTYRDNCSSCGKPADLKELEIYEMKSGSVLLLCGNCYEDYKLAEKMMKGTQ